MYFKFFFSPDRFKDTRVNDIWLVDVSHTHKLKVQEVAGSNPSLVCGVKPLLRCCRVMTVAGVSSELFTCCCFFYFSRSSPVLRTVVRLL